jgi:long-chain acyl-CoA synthetase
VLKKIKHRLGLDHMRHFTSGSAKLHVEVAMTFLGIGVPITEGYGLTETSPIITVNAPEKNRYGTVGPPIEGVEVRIAEDGEILSRGRHIMLGYYRDPEATAAVIQDGWFHTGDIGELDEESYLRITDRKKEIFKTAGGKFVAPARVEAEIRRSIFLSQAMVIGDGRPHPAALVIPNWNALRVQLNLPADATSAELARREDVRRFLTAEVASATAKLGDFEQIRRVFVLPNDFTVESGELSPSMKIKRRVVERQYMAAIERGYQVDLHECGFV